MSVERVTLPNNFLRGFEKLLGKNDLRPTLKNVFFKDGFAYAANEHVGVKLDLSVYGLDHYQKHWFDGMYLTDLGLADIKTKRNDKLIAEKGKITLYSGGKKRYTVDLVPEDDIGKYPNIEAVLPKFDSYQELKSIRFNAQYLMDLQSAHKFVDDIYKQEDETLELHFFGERRTILATNLDKTFIGFFMPKLVNK